MEIDVGKRPNLSQTVAERLLVWLKESGLKQGDKIPTEKELMEQLGIGRSSLREAIQGLALLGILEVKVGSGTYFRNYSTETLLKPSFFQIMVEKDSHAQLVQARTIIEPEIVALACENATDEDFTKINLLLRKHRASLISGEDTSLLSATFHLLLAEVSHNVVFFYFMSSILSLMAERGQDILDQEEFSWWEFEDHTKIFNLLKERNKEKVKELMATHIQRSAEEYNHQFNKKEGNK